MDRTAPAMAEFGIYLRNFRIRSKMTQSALSRKIGVTKQTILKWEKMSSFPARGILLKNLADSLHLPFQDFFRLKSLRKSQNRQQRISESKDPVISASSPNFVPLLDHKAKTLPLEQIKNPSLWNQKRYFLPDDLFAGFIFAFEISDGHMQPNFRKKDIVLADIRESLKVGHPAVIKVKGHPPVCRIYSSHGHFKVLSALDSKIPVVKVRESDVDWCHAVIRHMGHSG